MVREDRNQCYGISVMKEGGISVIIDNLLTAKSQLPANCFGLSCTPVVSTHCCPLVIKAYLNPSFVWRVSILKSYL